MQAKQIMQQLAASQCSINAVFIDIMLIIN